MVDILNAFFELPNDLFIEILQYFSPNLIIGHLISETKIGQKIFNLIRLSDTNGRLIRQSVKKSLTIHCDHVDQLYQKNKFADLLNEMDSPFIIIDSMTQIKSFIYYKQLKNDIQHLFKNKSEKVRDNLLYAHGIPSYLIPLLYWFNVVDIESFNDLFGFKIQPFISLHEHSLTSEISSSKMNYIYHEKTVIFKTSIRLSSKFDKLFSIKQLNYSNNNLGLIKRHPVRIIPKKYKKLLKKIFDKLQYRSNIPSVNKLVFDITRNSLILKRNNRVDDIIQQCQSLSEIVIPIILSGSDYQATYLCDKILSNTQIKSNCSIGTPIVRYNEMKQNVHLLFDCTWRKSNIFQTLSNSLSINLETDIVCIIKLLCVHNRYDKDIIEVILSKLLDTCSEQEFFERCLSHQHIIKYLLGEITSGYVNRNYYPIRINKFVMDFGQKFHFL